MPEDAGATMIASAAAGVVGRLFCHPLDTCKARLQVQTVSASADHAMYRHTVDALTRTARQEGLRGLYKGFSVAAVGGAPATCLYLTSYEMFAAQLGATGAGEDSGITPSAVVPFCAGMLAETLSCLLWVPIDVVKERLQVQGSPGARASASTGASQYLGPLHAGRAILHQEGVRGLYKVRLLLPHALAAASVSQAEPPIHPFVSSLHRLLGLRSHAAVLWAVFRPVFRLLRATQGAGAERRGGASLRACNAGYGRVGGFPGILPHQPTRSRQATLAGSAGGCGERRDRRRIHVPWRRARIGRGAQG